MNKILKKTELSEDIKDIIVHSPVIARKRKPGQFIILRINETGERIPLTIVDSSPEEGTIRLIFQEIGKTTYALGDLEEGDTILDIAGPLGNPTHIEKFGTVVMVGGGVGVAVVYPVTVAMKAAGNNVISIIGARTHDLMILEREMASVSDRLIVTTDDGSYGMHGFVTDALQALIDEGVKIDLCLAIGPVVMMRAVSSHTEKYNIHTVVSLNSVMIDGTGMCGGCRVTVDEKTRFVCVDGPEFDGHKVDYDELIKRQQAYLPQEKQSLEQYLKEREKGCALDAKSKELQVEK